VVATGLFHGLFLLPIIIRSFAFGVGDWSEAPASLREEEKSAEMAKVEGTAGTQKQQHGIGGAKVGPVMKLSVNIGGGGGAEESRTEPGSNIQGRQPQQQQQRERSPYGEWVWFWDGMSLIDLNIFIKDF